MQPAIPIILISGYLGAGKTTYLNRLLSEASGRKLAILVNDFGAINIDASLVKYSTNDVVALQNGCICCSLAMGMHSAILRVIKQDDRPEAILIEASGVANPGEIAKILSDETMRPYASLELIITMLDCENITSYKPTELKLINEQIRFSGITMLTKTALASAESVTYAKEFVKNINPSSVVIEDYQKILNLDLLLATKQENIEINETNPNTHANNSFRSWSYDSTHPLTESDFQNVINLLPADTIRGKGYVYLKDYPEVRFEFQMVGKNAQVQPGGEWGIRNPKTEIVFIALKS